MTQPDQKETFTKPNLTERLLNRFVGVLLKLGLGPHYMYTLEVPGRKSGKIHGTPVDLMAVADHSYIVAPRGATQWVRNARVAGTFTLRRGNQAYTCTFSELANEAKGALLKEYLTRYSSAVQQFFPITPGAELAEFEALAPRYPIFEVQGAPRSKG